MTKEQFKKWDELKSQITELREKNVICKYICNLIDELEKQMSNSEKPNKWIPISKEVPEESGYYLTTTMFNQVYCDYWNGVTFERSETVIAWMPLPLPYKAESEE